MVNVATYRMFLATQSLKISHIYYHEYSLCRVKVERSKDYSLVSVYIK